jgi:4-hydroxybenzoyl-CoA reductase subunit beta
MLRMDGFRYLPARSPDEAVAHWHGHDAAQYVAGGTDLLPNVKHRIFKPRHLVGLAGALPRGWETRPGEAGEMLWIGAGTTLSALARMAEIPALAAAAGAVAGPQIRNMGTLGGNILLDTRCLFYNQTEAWRTSLGFCLKAEGSWCHVVGGPKTCVATQSSDTVPMLLALNASIRLLGPDGARELALRDLYRFNGMDHLQLRPGELLTHVIVPLPGPGLRGSYQKLRTRGAIDFPQLSVAIVGTFQGRGASAVSPDLEIVVGAVNPQPKAIAGLDKLRGQALDDAMLDQIADLVVKRTRPQASTHGDPAWRRQLAGVFVKRALARLRDGLPVPVEA